MTIIEEKFLQATKDILEKNLKINDSKYKNHPIIFLYDLDSPLSKEVSKWYIANLSNIKNAEIIDFNSVSKKYLIEKLSLLEEDSTVIMVQSTNFMLNEFRIRLNLNNAWVGCLEHKHLAYIYDDQIENYADSIAYNTPEYIRLWNKLKNLTANSKTMTFICNDWSVLKAEGGFEDMKINSWDFEWRNRGWNMPIWENFTEVLDFTKLNWELSIYAYPDEKLRIEVVKEPIKIQINSSIVTCSDEKCSENFRKILNFISSWEEWIVYLRELWFGLNTWITRQKQIADINSYERIAGFHVSLWKKHQIYRKKLDKNIIQRYHIDIFVDIKEIYIWETLVFKEEKYVI